MLKKFFCLGIIFSTIFFCSHSGYAQEVPSIIPQPFLSPSGVLTTQERQQPILSESPIYNASQGVFQGPLPRQDGPAWLPGEGSIDYISSFLIPAISGFNAMIEPNTGLPYDAVNIDGMSPLDPKVSGLEIGLEILNVIAQRDLNLITPEDAVSKMSQILDSIDKAAKSKGFLYDFISLPGLKKVGEVTDVFNSGALAATLMIANQAFKGTGLEERCQKILDGMNFKFFDSGRGQLFGSSRKDYTVGQFGSEGLLAALVAVLTDGVSENVLAPSDTIGISQKSYTTADGKEINVIGSWGGQIWTILMPLLFLGPQVDDPATPEIENYVQGFMENARRWVEIQAEEARKKDLSIWGWSPCAVVSPRYNYTGVNGVPGLEEYGDAGNTKVNPVAPYVSFLALGALTGYEPAAAQLEATVENLENIPGFIPDLGFVDSVAQDGEYAPFFLALDKGMEVVGIFNAYQRSKGLQGIEGYFWQYLEENGMAGRARELLKERSEEILQTIGVEVSATESTVTLPEEPVTATRFPAMDFVAFDVGEGFINGPFGDDSGDYLDSSFESDPERGTVLRLDYETSVSRQGYAFDVFTFDKVSIPLGMNYLVVDIKGVPKNGTQFPVEQLKIELKQDPQVISSVYTSEAFGSEWKTLYIPLNGSVNWIDALGFILESHKASQSGTIYIDRIGFVKEKP